jgi:hypothetical protein
LNVTSKDQIRGLRREALRNYDLQAMRAAICDLALEGEVDPGDYGALSVWEHERLAAMTREEAVAECAEALGVDLDINDDAAPREDPKDHYRAWRDDGDR